MKKLKKDSPRRQAAMRRTAKTKEDRALWEAQEQLKKENKLRAIFGKKPQRLGG